MQETHPIERACWRNMKARCFNPKNGSYPYYGARGILVDRRWRTRRVSFRGENVSLPEACSSLGVCLDTVRSRINHGGWSPQDAVDIKVRKRTKITPSLKRRIRSMRGKTQDAIALACGVGQATVSSILRRDR